MTCARFPCACTAFVCALLLFAPLDVRGADKIRLAPNLAPADAYVEFTVQTLQKMDMPDGKPMEVESRSAYGVLLRMTAKGESTEATVTLDRLRGQMSFRSSGSSEGVKSSYDTDDPDNEEASPDYRAAFTPILNMPLRITLDGRGVGQSVDGAAAIRAKLLALGEQNFIAKSLADEDFSDARAMTAFGETLFVLFPYREVKVGETWQVARTETYSQVGRARVQYDCTLDRLEKSGDGDVAVVRFTGTIAKDPDETPAEGKRLGTIDGTFRGTGRFSASQGRFVEIRQQIDAKLGVPPWWSREPTAPLMKIDARYEATIVAAPAAERIAQRDEAARRTAEARARREAEEAAAMAGPVDPVTPENAAVPWLQWGGPSRDFRSDATGLANRWSAGGPPRLWERPLGDGYSAILCDGEALYTMYSLRNADDPFQGDEVVVALDARTGATLWEHKYPAPWPRDLQMEFGPGPHSTPILVGDRLFTVGTTAQLFCLDRRTGKVHWSKDLHAEYKAALNMRGYGSSPLAHNGSILLPISREGDRGVMAFSQADGAVTWSAGDQPPGYASLQLIDVHGVPQIVAFTGKSVCGLAPADGATTWSVDHPTQFGANISTPVWGPQDQMLFVSSAYGMGSRGIRLERDGDKIVAKEIWSNNKVKIQHANAVRAGDWVYASSGDFGPAFLCCVHAQTGELGWRQRGIAKANVLHADGKLIVLDEDGTLCLVKADAAAYRLLAKAPGVLEKTAWTVPTLYGRTLFLRDRKKIAALDLSAKAGA